MFKILSYPIKDGVILCLCGSWQADSGFSVAPLSKTRTVKRSVWITATVDIFRGACFFMSGKQYSKELKLGHFLCLSVRKTRSGQFREVP